METYKICKISYRDGGILEFKNYFEDAQPETIIEHTNNLIKKGISFSVEFYESFSPAKEQSCDTASS